MPWIPGFDGPDVFGTSLKMYDDDALNRLAHGFNVRREIWRCFMPVISASDAAAASSFQLQHTRRSEYARCVVRSDDKLNRKTTLITVRQSTDAGGRPGHKLGFYAANEAHE